MNSFGATAYVHIAQMANVSWGLEGADIHSHKTIFYIYKIIVFLRKAIPIVEDSKLCMRQEIGVGCAK